MSEFPNIAVDFTRNKYLSTDNVKLILNRSKEALCLKKIDNELATSIYKFMRQIIEKYKGDNINKLNDFTIKQISERFAPLKKVYKAIGTTTMPTYPMPEDTQKYGDEIPSKTITSPKTSPKTTPPNKKETFTENAVELENVDESTNGEENTDENKGILSKFFSRGKAEYRKESGIFYNADMNLFYNPALGWLLNPDANIFIDAKTGLTLTKANDDSLNKFFNILDDVDESQDVGSKFGFYDPISGSTVSRTRGIGSSVKTTGSSGIFGRIGGGPDIKVSDRYRSEEDSGIIVTEYIISIDSRHRDVRQFPSSSRYSIAFQKKNDEMFGYINNLGDIVRGVTKVELVSGIIPNIFKLATNIITDTYLLIEIDEIIGRFFNSSPTGKNIFGKVVYDLDLPINVDYLKLDPILSYRVYKPEPLSTTLSSLTLNILNFNGSLVNFGTDTFQLRYWQVGGPNTTIITTWLPHMLSTGDVIYFRNSGNPLLDNEFDGLTVLVISPTVFTVPIDSSTVAAGGAINTGGPPIDPTNPSISDGFPFPTVPPNDPNNPSDFFGRIMIPQLQNTFTFKITTEEKTRTRVSAEKLAETVSSY